MQAASFLVRLFAWLQTPRGALGVALLVSLLVGVISAVIPSGLVATLIAAVFLGATWLLVWRQDDAWVLQHGLGIGGLLLPDRRVDLGAVGRSAGLVLALSLLAFVPFTIGYVLYFQKLGYLPMQLHFAPDYRTAAQNLAGHLLIVALPEEAFYRGYLQTQLSELWPPKWSIFGTKVGPAILVTSVIFAVGHIITIHHPARLAVFFPSLLFGFMRSRTGGIGAALVFHALCNSYSEFLGKGFGLF
jgi:uncharacterized protein